MLAYKVNSGRIKRRKKGSRVLKMSKRDYIKRIFFRDIHPNKIRT